MAQNNTFDVIIVGGSYAGLSAAMALGRSLRNVLIIDSGKPCNRQTPHAHNFLTHDGDKPAEITAVAKEQVLKYPTITFKDGIAKDAKKDGDLFKIETEDGESFSAKKLLFATGLIDIMPETPGYAECWGISILHCPYCHGYEIKGEKTGIIANGPVAFEISKMINHWTKDLTIFTDGKALFSDEDLEKLKSNNIAIVENEIESFEHDNGYIQKIIFKDGSDQGVKALYARPHTKQQCEIPQIYECETNSHGCIETDTFQKTTVAGIYAAGDCATVGRSIPVAVAAGSVAGAFINKELIEDEF